MTTTAQPTELRSVFLQPGDMQHAFNGHIEMVRMVRRFKRAFADLEQLLRDHYDTIVDDDTEAESDAAQHLQQRWNVLIRTAPEVGKRLAEYLNSARESLTPPESPPEQSIGLRVFSTKEELQAYCLGWSDGGKYRGEPI